MLAHRLRRRANIYPTPAQRLVFTGPPVVIYGMLWQTSAELIDQDHRHGQVGVAGYIPIATSPQSDHNYTPGISMPLYDKKFA